MEEASQEIERFGVQSLRIYVCELIYKVLFIYSFKKTCFHNQIKK